MNGMHLSKATSTMEKTQKRKFLRASFGRKKTQDVKKIEPLI